MIGFLSELSEPREDEQMNFLAREAAHLRVLWGKWIMGASGHSSCQLTGESC